MQEENSFKAYLYLSPKWTKSQLEGAIKYRDKSFTDMGLPNTSAQYH